MVKSCSSALLERAPGQGNAGMLVTPIYMNVQKWVEGGKDVISVNFRGGGAGSMEDYGLSPKTGKYHKLEN